MQACQRTIDWMRPAANRQEAARLWHQYLTNVGVKYDLEVITQTFKDIPEEHFTLKINKEALATLEGPMLEFKLIDRKVDWRTLIDQQFLAPAQRITL